LMKRVTQLSETGSWATAEAKFRIISLVGGTRRAVSSSMYFTSSASCCRVSFCCATACSSRERVSPRHLRVNVERTTPCLSAIFDQGISSSDTKVSHSLRASSKPIALWWCGAERTKALVWFGLVILLGFSRVLRSYARSGRLWQTADVTRTLIRVAPLHLFNETSCP
jgi:hypothetical protein